MLCKPAAGNGGHRMSRYSWFTVYVRNECAAPYRQIRIFKGIGDFPNEKNTDVARKAAPVFLPLYIQRPCSPVCQFVIQISIAPETPYKRIHFFLHKPLHLSQYFVGNMYHSQAVRFDNR